jgi:hypothetical protein
MFKVQFGRDLGQTLSERFKEPPFKQVGITINTIPECQFYAILKPFISTL